MADVVDRLYQEAASQPYLGRFLREFKHELPQPQLQEIWRRRWWAAKHLLIDCGTLLAGSYAELPKHLRNFARSVLGVVCDGIREFVLPCYQQAVVDTMRERFTFETPDGDEVDLAIVQGGACDWRKRGALPFGLPPRLFTVGFYIGEDGMDHWPEDPETKMEQFYDEEIAFGGEYGLDLWARFIEAELARRLNTKHRVDFAYDHVDSPWVFISVDAFWPGQT